MQRPSHATIVAYLALFAALGGTAFAASQLPRNSVGAKQLKPNAVTAAKIKTGAVTAAKVRANALTGEQIDESKLGQVPSAATAGSAATAATATAATTAASADSAANAGDADALGGVPPAGYLQTGDVQFGSATLNAFFQQDLVKVPGGFRISTVGDAQDVFKVNIENLSSETWLFMTDSSIASLTAEDATVLSFGSTFQVDIFAVSLGDHNRHAVIDCAYASTTPGRIFCSGRIAPAA
jgi:hypothetical protein